MTEQAMGATWCKSSRSGGAGNCVELSVGTARTGVRDTKDSHHSALTFSAEAFGNFLTRTRSR